MGYTSYFSRPESFDEKTFTKFAADVRKLFKASVELNKTLEGDEKIFLANGRGEIGTSPVANKEKIVFNGMKLPDFDGSYETLYIPRVFERSSWQTPDEKGLFFDFCKTARLPYDLVVSATLIALKKHFPEVEIASDGNNKDDEWIAAKKFCQDTLGYGKDFNVDKGEFKKPKQKSKKTYKCWIVIEEHTEFPDGSDEYKDVKDTTASVGTFSNLKDAIEHMENLSEQHKNSGDI